jgi:uncharacterized membrane protein YbhN (UPF0104 family)
MDASLFGLSSHQVMVLTGAFIALVVVASAALTHRDAWLAAIRSRPQLVRWTVAAVVLAVAGTFAAGHLDELHDLIERLSRGDLRWLAAAAGLEAISFVGYVVLTYLLYHPRLPRIDWPTATSLTLAGVVATRLLATGGAGGIAFTGWVLHRAGMGTREAARRLTAFLVLIYAVYMAILLVAGILVLAGVPSEIPHAIAVMAVLVGAGSLAVGVAATYLPPTLEERAFAALERRGGRLQAIGARLATVPQVLGNGVRMALRGIRERPSVLWWALVWWIFDVAVLWATFHAFGEPPGVLVLLIAYFLGMLGNLLPIPGGVGGTEGGMTAVLVASGVSLELALASVVAYQVISSYLPAIPGLASYAHLRRRMAGWAEPPPDPDEPEGPEAAGTASLRPAPNGAPLI